MSIIPLLLLVVILCIIVFSIVILVFSIVILGVMSITNYIVKRYLK